MPIYVLPSAKVMPEVIENLRNDPAISTVTRNCGGCGVEVYAEAKTILKHLDSGLPWRYLCSECAPPELLDEQITEDSKYWSEQTIDAMLAHGATLDQLLPVICKAIMTAEGGENISVGKYTPDVTRHLVNVVVPKLAETDPMAALLAPALTAMAESLIKEYEKKHG